MWGAGPRVTTNVYICLIEFWAALEVTGPPLGN